MTNKITTKHSFRSMLLTLNRYQRNSLKFLKCFWKEKSKSKRSIDKERKLTLMSLECSHPNLQQWRSLITCTVGQQHSKSSMTSKKKSTKKPLTLISKRNQDLWRRSSLEQSLLVLILCWRMARWFRSAYVMPFRKIFSTQLTRSFWRSMMVNSLP